MGRGLKGSLCARLKGRRRVLDVPYFIVVSGAKGVIVHRTTTPDRPRGIVRRLDACCGGWGRASRWTSRRGGGKRGLSFHGRGRCLYLYGRGMCSGWDAMVKEDRYFSLFFVLLAIHFHETNFRDLRDQYSPALRPLFSSFARLLPLLFPMYQLPFPNVGVIFRRGVVSCLLLVVGGKGSRIPGIGGAWVYC